MIAVIADDLTGAAEIGGIALRQGLRVVMDTRVHGPADVDVLVIATDSRSKEVEEAKALVGDVTEKLLALHPTLIFKKTDSLLRGHVGEELAAQMKVSGKRRTLLIPANPALGRTIRAGVYYAGDVPLNESVLADAFRKKIRSSGVLHLIGDKFKSSASVVSLADDLPHNGLVIGNTQSESDLDAWASRLDDDTIAAGSAGFFNAVLKTNSTAMHQGVQDRLMVGQKIIYVCGSAFPLSKASVAEARSNGLPVCYMPEAIFCAGANNEELIRGWAADAVNSLHQKDKVIMAVGGLLCDGLPDLSSQIKGAMAAVVAAVMQQTQVNELVIEGGATASSVIERLRYERFFPAQELAQGVLRMRVQEAAGLHLTMKPGSYQWPASIWNGQWAMGNEQS